MPVGPRTRRACFVLFLLWIGGGHWPAAAADEAGSVVILRNGNILEGVVRPLGTYYRIERFGATLQVPANQVEAVCASLDEAYEVRRRSRVGSSVDSNIELARWCLRHKLLDQAAREILDARTKDPHHPAINLLDLQLQQQLEVLAAQARTTANPGGPRRDSGVVAAALAEHPETASPPPSPSTEAQAAFVRSIQPMLIHNCATGGCHQPGSRQRLQLDRWAQQGNGNPALIRQNLEAVLAYVNRDDPPSSPIIRWARQSHGLRGARPSAPLASYQAGLLLEWLGAACGVESAPTSDGVENGVPTDALPPTDAQRAPYAEHAYPSPAGSSSRSATLAAAKPALRDPFDPEAFNREAVPSSPTEDPTAAAGEATHGHSASRGDEAESQETASPLPPVSQEAAIRENRQATE
ncbi:MAG: hypothetical protein DCC67_03585 [Planctomycetota bacterium]|nr:MAG: hypothetical protein DCC67_03585 [Planctomycetota bacterium]